MTRLLQDAGARRDGLEARKTLAVGLAEDEDTQVSGCCPLQAWRTPCVHTLPGSGSHRSGSIVDAALGRGGAASQVALTRVDGDAHAPVSVVAMVTGARVLVRTCVDAGGVDMAHVPETRVDG